MYAICLASVADSLQHALIKGQNDYSRNRSSAAALHHTSIDTSAENVTKAMAVVSRISAEIFPASAS